MQGQGWEKKPRAQFDEGPEDLKSQICNRFPAVVVTRDLEECACVPVTELSSHFLKSLRGWDLGTGRGKATEFLKAVAGIGPPVYCCEGRAGMQGKQKAGAGRIRKVTSPLETLCLRAEAKVGSLGASGLNHRGLGQALLLLKA